MTPDNAIWWLRLKAKQKQTQKYEGPVYQGGTLPTTDITAKKPSREVMGKNVRMGIHEGSIDERSLNPEQKEALQLYDFKQKVASRPIGKEIIEAHLSPLSIGANLSGYVANKWKGDGKARFDEINSDRSRQVSKELGIENPVGAFLTDVLTDPTTFLGATSVAKLLMNPKRIGDVAKIIVTGSKQLPKKGMGLIDDAIKLSNNLKSKVDDVIRPIASSVDDVVRSSRKVVNKADNVSLNKPVQVETEHIGEVAYKEINELNKERIVDLNEHWIYKNAEDIHQNKMIKKQLEQLQDEQKKLRERYKLYDKRERVKGIDDIIEQYKNGFKDYDPTDPFVIKHKDPKVIDEIIKEKEIIQRQILDHGEFEWMDMLENTQTRLSKSFDELGNQQSEIRNLQDALYKKAAQVPRQKSLIFNPHIKVKIEKMYKDAGMSKPNLLDPYEGMGLQDKTHIVYPFIDESNFSKIPSSQHNKIREKIKTTSGWRNRDATVAYGMDYIKKDLVPVFEKSLVKKPFSILDMTTWRGNKMKEVSRPTNEFIEKIHLDNVPTKTVKETVAHETTHDTQKIANMGEIIDKWDDGVKYYTTHGENKVSKLFQDNLVSSTDDAWLSSGNELWADFGAQRLLIIDKLSHDPKKAVELFVKNSSTYIDEILDSGRLNKFFKQGVSRETKKQMLEYLSVAGVGTTLGFSDILKSYENQDSNENKESKDIQ